MRGPRTGPSRGASRRSGSTRRRPSSCPRPWPTCRTRTRCRRPPRCWAASWGLRTSCPGWPRSMATSAGWTRRATGCRCRRSARSEEGREILLAVISDPENLAELDRWREITARLADPRRTSREEARRLAEEGKVFYYLTGGLHSTETGSPEMLMELAYRLAVSEKPEIQAIRENAIVLITPVSRAGRPRPRGRVVLPPPARQEAAVRGDRRDPVAAVLGPLRLPRQQPRRHAGHPGAHPRRPRAY